MTGETKNLSDGSTQALQALLHSLTPDAAAEAGGKLSPAALEKLSAKLSELVGDEAGEPQRRNEKGQLLNEEGLPIIDIAEPVPASDAHATSGFLNEDAPTPLAALPISEQERRRHERDRILDLLEEEERREQAREDGISEEQRQEILQKRKQAAQDERARLKAAKDMQRKMGKALLRDMTPSRDKPTPDPTPSSNLDFAVEEVQETVPNPRKTVTFADAAVEAETTEADTSDWGDVVPARLRANSKPSLMSNAQPDSTPMKMHVVERIPGKPVVGLQPDSDDESEPPDSPTISDEDEEGGFESDEELAEEIDVDFARHQREIALEYHAKRAKMAETASQALQSDFHDKNDHKTGEDSINLPFRKPAISHFQANRLASSYNAATPSSSTSLGANVVPASTAQTFQRAIRMGKLDSDNRLIGGDAGESGSDEEGDADMQEIAELLKKGEVYNLGPDGNYLHMVPPNPPAASTATIPPPVTTPEGPPPSSRKPPTSKFKLARSGRTPAAALPSPDASGSSTPTSSAPRSSPKLSTPVTETPSSSNPTVLSSTVVEKLPPSANTTAFGSMIVDSPSFPQSRRPQHPPTVVRAADKAAKVSRFLAERM
ncbi:hypothetical protein MVEN_02031900 [Mycena venus]|uniref:DUF3835 domain-containing protein n=1 Tax=Mycena venus TaxID=2733690 RepID=A0A8H6XCQ7_9AGAR|nr:hypothetical protein MVEN_02031900 [Mycena venus]